MIQPNKYVIHTTNTKLFGHISLCYGSGYGYISADKEEIEVCETKHPTDYKIVSEWIQKTG